MEEKTWIIIKDGKSVKNHGIDIRTLAKILQDVQKAYDNIGQSKYGDDYKKDDFKLYTKEIIPGSVALPVYPETIGPRLIDAPDPFRVVTHCFEHLIETIDTNPGDFKSHLEKEVSDPSNRLGLLKSMQSLSQNDSPIILKISATKPQSGPTFDKKNADVIKTLLQTYAVPSEMTITGIMLGFHAEKAPYYFTLKTVNGRSIRCYFDEEKADSYQSYFWKWVSVKGLGVTTQRKYYIKSVSELSEHTYEEFDNIGGEYQLRKPLKLDTSYEKEDKLWCLTSKELAIYGCGESYSQAIDSLKDEIESLAICFTKFGDEELTDDSPAIRQQLQEYVDIKQVYSKVVEKYGEAE